MIPAATVPTAAQAAAILAGIRARRDWRAELRRHLENVATAPATERADWLRLAAFRLGRMVISHGAPEADVRTVLLFAGRRAGIQRAGAVVTEGLVSGTDYERSGLP
jgi:hypothetical protein